MVAMRHSALSPDRSAEAETLLKRTRVDLPTRITDPTVIASVAGIIGLAASRGPRRGPVPISNTTTPDHHDGSGRV